MKPCRAQIKRQPVYTCGAESVKLARRCLSKLRQAREIPTWQRVYADYIFKKRGVSFTARINHELGCTAITSFLHSFSFYLRKQSRVLQPRHAAQSARSRNAIFRRQYARFNPYVRYDLNWISDIKLNHISAPLVTDIPSK